MKPSIQNLGQILYAPAQYVIPVFQRNYRWELPQWEKLWESLVEIQSPEKRGNHFMGFLVFVPGLAQPGQHTTFHLIDGQQRLSTSSILLIAIRNVARRHGQVEFAEEVHGYYLVHPLKKADQHFRLLPKERDHDTYVALVHGSTAEGRMADALRYFEQQCEAIAQETPTRFRALFDTICQRLEFMCATLEAENAYNIFKSLNSTGVPLGPADLIRNFVFMHVPPDEQDEFDLLCWSQLEGRFTQSDGSFDEEQFSRFFRDYLMSAGKYVSPKDTFDAFEARFEATAFAPKELAADLIRSADYYAVITGRRRDPNESVSVALGGLNQLDSSTTYSLILSLFDKRARGTLTTEQLASAIEMLKGFILRRFICGDSSRGYGQMFVRALARDEGEDCLPALEDYLLDRGWPDDRRFIEAFAAFPLYERRYAREVLEALERARGHKEPADLQSAQIEHVMPQTLSDSWREALAAEVEKTHADLLHCPGNLTLSGYNAELWNHSFDVKRKRYADSNVVLTRELANFSNWNAERINDRGRQMGAAAAAVWRGPRDPLPSADSSDDGAPRFALRSKFWSMLRLYLVGKGIPIPEFESEPRRMHVSVPSSVRHVGIRLRYSIEQSSVAVVVWFWRREARTLWEQLRAAPAALDDMVKGRWVFSDVPGRDRARMKIEQGGIDLRDEGEWPSAFRWFEAKLPLVYERVLPSIRALLGQAEVVDIDKTPSLSPADVMEQICPDELQRKFVAAQLVRSIEVADSISPKSWAVTLFLNGFRLNVGAVEALTFVDGNLRVLLHGAHAEGRVRGGEISECTYRQAPQPSFVFRGEVSRYEQVVNELEAAHAAYIRGAAIGPSGRPRRTSFARHHSPELVDYARKMASV